MGSGEPDEADVPSETGLDARSETGAPGDDHRASPDADGLRSVRPIAAAAVTAGLTIAVAQLAERAVASENRLALVALANATLMGGLAVIGALASRDGAIRALLLERPAAWVRAPAIALLALGCLGLSHLLDAATRQLAVREESQLAAIEATIQSAAGPSLPLLLVGLALAPGIAEELLFRGLLLRASARRLGTLPAMLLCAGLFGAAHLDLLQGLGAALLGVYLALVVVVTGSLRVAIVCHVLNNALATLLAMLGAALPALRPTPQLALAALITTLSCWLLARRWPGARVDFARAIDVQAETAEAPRGGG